MKQGKSLTELAQELDRCRQSKRDFGVNTRYMEVVPGAADDGGGNGNQYRGDRIMPMALKLEGIDEGREWPLQRHALNQMGDRVGIPRKFQDRLADRHPDLLAHNLNTLFEREPEVRQVRTLDGRVRAFLSKKYRMIDNYDLAEVILPILMQAKAEVVSCDVTWQKLYIKARHPDLVKPITEWPEGAVRGRGHHFRQTCRAAVVVENSEVGLGRVRFAPAILTEECTNLAIFEKHAFSKYHVGRGKEFDIAAEIESDQTKLLSDAAVLSKIRDLAHASMSGETFEKIVEELKGATQDVIEGDPVKAVEIFSENKGLRDTEKTGILTHLLQGGDMTRFGLHAAITRASSDVGDYDRATELENLGGQIIDMKPDEWSIYRQAA